MELRQIQYFVAVAELKHFGRAAASLQMTQPPLSQQIAKLEDEMGVLLFARTQRKVELTPAGEQFLTSARRLLNDVHAAVDTAQRIHRGELGRLRVGFVGSATYDILPSVLRTYRSRFPDVDVSLQEFSTPDQEEALLQGRIDVGIMRPPVVHGGIDVAEIQTMPCVLALPSRHPLADARRLPLAALAGESFVLLSRSTWSGFYDDVLGTCHRHGFSPRIAQEAREFQTVLGLVAGGMGVAVVPQSAQHVHTAEVTYRPDVEGLPTASMGVMRRTGDVSPLVRAFVEACALAQE